ncbi:alpha/beta hydrolase [Streptomyces sp. HU2014]|uniref:Hydrolase n=1 Tax=Streptomyces albireticuli TaxID=1940 RepID=A0A1Z2KVS4_9ACTN|nr:MULTISPECIES: alpha/beta hydrolase [Streptomyces]ARZ66157.1 hydrolase [Streptomyces albireticuli]UQI46405.1 alpha/beta hydrolase [Streptomyces sp. HU2014]
MTTPSPAARRTAAVGLALAACLGATPAVTATAAPTAPGSGAGLDRYYNQRPAWGSCVTGPDDTMGRGLDKAGVRCADVTVPLDYADPRGRTITVAISRLKATDTRHRIGSILLNNGGPGGTAVDSPPEFHTWMKKAGPRYDIVGFDPRFVGRSTPLDCGWPVGTNLFSAGLGRASFERQVAFQKDLAAKCRATNASVLPHVSTRNTARDMDVIRGALGEKKISYFGYSYGTYLGTVYTQMFPGRTDRVVLDGAIDPRKFSPRLLQESVGENERALADWATWAAARDDTYGLGRTRAQVLATVDRLIRTSARAPLTVGTAPETFRLDDTHIPFLLLAGVDSDTDTSRASLAEQVSVLNKAAAGQPAHISKQFAATLRLAMTGERSHYGSAQTAIICGDRAAPRDPEVYWRDIERGRAAYPRFGALADNIGPCAFWDRPREEPTQVKHDAKALIVSATGDPRTTHKGAVALHGLLPSSKLITLQGANRHAIYGLYENSCVDDKVNQYLATGELPAGDQTCSK